VRLFGLSIQELLAFPYRRLTLETSAPVVHVLKRIEQDVEPRKLWRFSRVHRDFEGVVLRSNFKITRIIHYRNSFLPVMVGTVQPRLQGGTRVEITMRLNRAIAAIMMLWAGVAVAVLLYRGLLASGAQRGNSLGALGFALAMACFAYIICAGGFNFEARRAIDILTGILKAEGDST
jgi:hypothetical protein